MLIPDWPAPDLVRAACSLRTGGVSLPPYDSLNLGDHVGDDPEAVAHNRRIFAQALQAKPVFLKQVHGVHVTELTSETQDGIEADACWTTQPGLACTIMVADCLPVLFAHRGLPLVGAAHAGWRGLCGQGGQGVLERLFQRFCQVAVKKSRSSAIDSIASTTADNILVWLGPCIGSQVFEVGAEVREAFVSVDERAQHYFHPIADRPGKFFAHLPGLARQRLATLGITQIYGNDGSDAWCTVSNTSRFYSHRRDRVSGRFAAAVWLVEGLS